MRAFMFSVLCGCVLSGCGGLDDSIAITIRNEFAVSLFKLEFSGDDQETWETIFDNRIESGRTCGKIWVREIDVERTFFVRFQATSLGQTNKWKPIEYKITGIVPRISYVYDYDLALGDFVMGHSSHNDIDIVGGE